MPTVEEIQEIRGLLLAVAPEAADLDWSRTDKVIEVAAGRVSEDVFGDQYHLAVAYLAAHMLMLSDPEHAGAGPISAEKIGDFSRSFATGGEREGVYGSTKYGREYLAIRQAVTFGPRTRVM